MQQAIILFAEMSACIKLLRKSLCKFYAEAPDCLLFEYDDRKEWYTRTRTMRGKLVFLCVVYVYSVFYFNIFSLAGILLTR